MALELSKLVRPVLMEHVAELARQVRGSARELVVELTERSPNRWRKDVTPELEAWFRANGYNDLDEQLDTDEVVIRVKEELAQQSLLDAVSPTTLARLCVPLARAPASW
jgi:hypothetical protein